MQAPERLRRKVGRFEVGPIALGTWRLIRLDASSAQGVIEASLQAGFDLLDTADVYGLDWGGTEFGSVETLLGRVFRSAPELRPRLVLASKAGIQPGIPYDSSDSYLQSACEASLSRLGVERLDLFQIHRPDFFCHPEQLARTVERLRDEGKICEVGVSNYTPSQVQALQRHLSFPLASTQPEFSAAWLEPLRDGTLDLAMAEGLAVLAWSPLRGGALASGEAVPPRLIEVLDELAANHETTRIAVALAFVLAHPSQPIPLLGTTRRERVAEARAALDLDLSRAELYRIVEASDGRPLP